MLGPQASTVVDVYHFPAVAASAEEQTVASIESLAEGNVLD